MQTFRLLSRTRQITEYSCGASALQAVLHYWGRDVDETELMRRIGTNSDVGTHPEDLARGVRGLGLQAEARENLTLDEVARITADGSPMIALGQVWRSESSGASTPEAEWDTGHYIVVLGVDDEFVYFQDPYLRMGKVFVTRRTFERHWHQIMGGAATGDRKLLHVGITVRGERPRATVPAPDAAPATNPRALDFSRLGSFELLVLRFPRVLLPFDLVHELKDVWAGGAVRPVSFILVTKSLEGDVAAMEGGSLEEDRDAAEVSALLSVLASRAVGSRASAYESAARTLEAAAGGDFGLSADSLRGLAQRLTPGHSAVTLLLENVWERSFRDVVRKFGGEVTEQRPLGQAAVTAAAQALFGARS